MAGGQNYIMPRTMPLGWAFWMLFTGQTIDAKQAYDCGLVQKVVPPEKLMEEANKLADTINANGPLVAQHSKEYTYRTMDVPLSTAKFMEGMFYADLRRHPDYDEGTRAFTEKRKPQFNPDAERK